MRRALLSLAMLAVLGIGTSSTFAAKPIYPPQQVLALAVTAEEIGRVVPQQSEEGSFCFQLGLHCVINPTGHCLWGVDDSLGVSGYGKFYPGTLSHTHCFYGDDRLTLARPTVTSKSADLVVTVSWEPSGFEVSYAPRWSEPLGQYVYGDCVEGPTYFSGLQPIPGSDGGFAVPGTVTFTVTNPGDRYIRDTGASFGIRQSSGMWRNALCTRPLGTLFSFGGASWKVPT